jgi:putative FmdB family regulatory protein
MPTYEYQCANCGHRFEQFQSITAPPLGHCPQCGGPLRRLIGAGAGVIVKSASPAGSAGRARGAWREGQCSLEERGRTCCGRAERCGTPPCDS